MDVILSMTAYALLLWVLGAVVIRERQRARKERTRGLLLKHFDAA